MTKERVSTRLDAREARYLWLQEVDQHLEFARTLVQVEPRYVAPMKRACDQAIVVSYGMDPYDTTSNRLQWLIIQGRLPGKLLAPSAVVTDWVDVPWQHPQPAGCLPPGESA